MAFSSDAERRRYWAKKKAAERGKPAKKASSGDRPYVPRQAPVDPHAHTGLEWPKVPQSDGDQVRCPGCGQAWIWDSERGWIPVPKR